MTSAAVFQLGLPIVSVTIINSQVIFCSSYLGVCRYQSNHGVTNSNLQTPSPQQLKILTGTRDPVAHMNAQRVPNSCSRSDRGPVELRLDLSFLCAHIRAYLPADWCRSATSTSKLVELVVLGDSLGSLTNSMLGQLARQQETDGRLDLSACDSRPLRVPCQADSFVCQPLESIVYERVHDVHRLPGDTDLSVHLLKYPVDIRRESLGTLAPAARALRLLCGLSALLAAIQLRKRISMTKRS